MDQRRIYAAVIGIIVISCITRMIQMLRPREAARVERARYQVRGYRVKSGCFPKWVSAHGTVAQLHSIKVVAPFATKLLYWATPGIPLRAGSVIGILEDQHGRTLDGLQAVQSFKSEQLNRLKTVYTKEAQAKGIADVETYVNNISAVGAAQQEHQKATAELASYTNQCVIFATADGVPGVSRYVPGDCIPHGECIGYFAATHTDTYVDAYFSDTEAHGITKGQRAVFILSSDTSGAPISGIVESKDPVVDKRHCGVLVRVKLTDQRICNQQSASLLQLQCNQNGTIKVQTRLTKKVAFIPSVALKDYGYSRIIVINNYDPKTKMGISRLCDIGIDADVESYGWSAVTGINEGEMISIDAIIDANPDGQLLEVISRIDEDEAEEENKAVETVEETPAAVVITQPDDNDDDITHTETEPQSDHPITPTGVR